MASHLVFTVIAQDRPGLVDRLADAIATAGGNWIESSMARLGGEFAGIVSVEIAGEAISDLQSAFQDLKAEGFEITLRSRDAQPELNPSPRVQMELLCQDQPGILRRVTKVLSGHGVSIETLDTSVQPGPMTGEPMFRASASLVIPEGLSPADLSNALQDTAADMMADISLDS